MTDSDNRADADRDASPVGLDEVIRTAGDVADRLRDAASSVARLGERELAMIVDVAEAIRSNTIARERLESARRNATIEGFRRSAHRGVDLLLDTAAVAVDVGTDFVDALLRRPGTAFAADARPSPAATT